MSSRIVELGGSGNVMVSDEIGCTIQRAATGRHVSFLSRDEKRFDVLAADWFAADSERGFLDHPARREFEDALRTAPKLNGVLLGYRGRVFACTQVTDPYEFGPPPAPCSTHGRYNRAGRPALYLATTVSGVVAELDRHQSDGSSLFCQRFSLDSRGLNIADLSRNDCSQTLAITFDYSELEREPTSYFKSQVLADSVERGGFDGMLVPGVRGSNENRYYNIVILGPGVRWAEWLDLEWVPQRIATR
jgi:hypothetical protein